MKPLFKTALLLLVSSWASGQACVHTDLSKTLTFVSTVKRMHRNVSYDTTVVTIRIIDKSNGKTLQEMTFVSDEIYVEDYSHCRMVRSYSTRKNIKREIIDKG
ncbi:hypothetical protein ACQ86N_46885 [Puia sp. P3]|uniref:hypothetical protein n=1 Tax=Puia sp. P3 TaxID=3423952 RepID=UPI003D670005